MKNMINANNKAWSKLSEDHYTHFSKKLKEGSHKLSKIIRDEIQSFDIAGKKLLHLQCNTGADSILLSKMGAKVTAVDLSASNIHYAQLLAEENSEEITFIESNVLTLMDTHHEKYDIVFTSEGVLYWLPEYDTWAENIRYFLEDDGIFYLNDSHPFYMVFDEDLIDKGELVAKYPYFDTKIYEENSIGGYASEALEAKSYGRSFTMGAIINALADAGLCIDYLHEYDRSSYGMSSHNAQDENDLVYIREFENKLPLTFSIKASVR